MMEIADRLEMYREAFDRLEHNGRDGRDGRDEPAWLTRRRREAMERFQAVGFPTTRQEAWKYTNVTPIAQTHFRPGEREVDGVDRSALAALRLAESEGMEAVFVNGRFSPELSSIDALPRGVVIGSLAEAIAQGDERLEKHLANHATAENSPFISLNTALISDGALVRIGRGVTVDRPIHLLFLSVPGAEPTASHPRVLILAEDYAQAAILESYAALESGQYLTNAVTEVIAGQRTVIEHCKLQRESINAYHIGAMQIELKGQSVFKTHSVALGSSLARNDVMGVLAGERIEATLNGLYVIGDRQHVDNFTTIDHAHPNCVSHELYKGVLDGQATGVFRGRILVRPGAQKTDAKQTNRALLLSRDASINAKPQLEIYADDVKCTHGATVGALDEDQLFYLRSRGVPLEEARNLLTYAFISRVVGRITSAPIRHRVEELIVNRQHLAQEVIAEGSEGTLQEVAP